MSQRKLVLIIAIVLVICVFFWARLEDLSQGEAMQKEKSGLPMRLKIPTLQVDAAIEEVGITREGAMDVPKGPDGVAWYSPGARPGEVGSAVLAGHTNWRNGENAVFDNLHKLKKGDEISVEDERGNTMIFVVRESRIYESFAYAPEVFTSSGGKHLNLITCSGTWDALKKTSNERLVVFADIVN